MIAARLSKDENEVLCGYVSCGCPLGTVMVEGQGQPWNPRGLPPGHRRLLLGPWWAPSQDGVWRVGAKARRDLSLGKDIPIASRRPMSRGASRDEVQVFAPKFPPGGPALAKCPLCGLINRLDAEELRLACVEDNELLHTMADLRSLNRAEILHLFRLPPGLTSG